MQARQGKARQGKARQGSWQMSPDKWASISINHCIWNAMVLSLYANWAVKHQGARRHGWQRTPLSTSQSTTVYEESSSVGKAPSTTLTHQLPAEEEVTRSICGWIDHTPTVVRQAPTWNLWQTGKRTAKDTRRGPPASSLNSNLQQRALESCWKTMLEEA